jgi:hypothetical protein
MKIEFNYKMNQKYIQIFNLQNHNWISNFHIKPKKESSHDFCSSLYEQNRMIQQLEDLYSKAVFMGWCNNLISLN